MRSHSRHLNSSVEVMTTPSGLAGVGEREGTGDEESWSGVDGY